MTVDKVTVDISVDYPKKGDLAVVWIPQFPMDVFEVPVSSVQEGKKILDVLADYDLFQYENKIKPDYANTGGLVEFDGLEWLEWVNEDGDTIDDLESL